MNERNFIYKLVRQTEEKFGCICYAHKDGNTNKTHVWWDICIDNYELYYSNEFRSWTKQWYSKSKDVNVNLLFCYCNPIEEKLAKFAEEDNLILNL